MKAVFSVLMVLIILSTGSDEQVLSAAEDSKFSNIENSHFGFMHPDHSMKEVKNLNVHWGRPHPGPLIWSEIELSKGVFDFDKIDKVVKLFNRYDVLVALTIWPYADWDQDTCRFPLDPSKLQYFRMLGDYRQKPCDMDDYKNFIKSVVERYDGDGINDMKGLKYPVKYWEVINEPSFQDELVFFYGTPKEYFDILKTSYEAIKEADPDANVLNGGIAHFEPDTKNYWQKIFNMGGANYFDIANHHSINGPENLHIPDMLKFMKKNKINKPLWMPEVQLSASAKERVWLTEEEWAELIVKTFVYSFSQGEDKLFYVGLDSHGPGDPESWLISKSGKKQKPYYAFKTMVAKLDYFTSVEKLEKDQYEFIVEGNSVFVLWGIGSVPSELTGTVFVTDIYGEKTRVDASSITLSDSPIFVEKIPAAYIHGYVKDKKTGKPIKLANVRAVRKGGSKKSAKTDKTGYYKLSDLDEGKWTLTVKKKGYKEKKSLVTVKTRKAYKRNIKLVQQS